MQKRLKAIFSLLLAIATVGVYWPVRHYDFVNYDDNDYVTSNAYVQAGLAKESVRWAFTQFHGEKTYWHPLTWLSHMLDVQLFGLNAGAHHLVSVGFHAVNGALLFLFLAYLTGSTWRSALVAVLFALHPLQVDTVAWVTERKNILSGMFYILVLWTYVAYARKRSFPRYLLALFLFILGLMCKPILVTVPCILLLLDFWPLGRLKLFPPGKDQSQPRTPVMPVGDEGDNRVSQLMRLVLLVGEKMPFFALSLASGVLTIWSHNQLGMREEAYGLPFNLRLENAFVSYARYLGKLVWPKNLCVLYLHPGEWPDEAVLLSLLVVAGITTLVLWRIRQQRYLLFGWAWFLVILLPTIGIRQVGMQSMADRFAYLPSIGIFLALVWGTSELAQRSKIPVPALRTVPVALVLVFTWVTSRQIPHWENSVTLFEQALRVDPRNFVACHNLAVGLVSQNRLREALDKENACISIRPDIFEYHVQKGLIHVLQQEPEEALASYQRALKLQLEASDLIEKNGLHLISEGKLDAAVLQFSNLAKLSPTNANAHFELGLLFSMKGEYALSIRSYSEALRIKPDFDFALNNLAWLLSTQPEAQFRDGNRAVQLAERACQLTGRKIPMMVGTLAAAYAETGRFEEAVRTAQEACQLAEVQGKTELLNTNRKLIEVYRKRQPWREKG